MKTMPMVSKHLVEIAGAVEPAEQRALEDDADRRRREERDRQRREERPAELAAPASRVT